MYKRIIVYIILLLIILGVFWFKTNAIILPVMHDDCDRLNLIDDQMLSREHIQLWYQSKACLNRSLAIKFYSNHSYVRVVLWP